MAEEFWTMVRHKSGYHSAESSFSVVVTEPPGVPVAMTMHRRQFLISLALTSASGSVVGCGTLLHPERRGQGSGRLDWRIVGLDAAGLVLFFVPGVIAFAVDFHQGTIFLPEGSAGIGTEHQSLHAVKMPRSALTRERVEETVSTHVNRRVILKPGTYRNATLNDLKSFWSSRDRLMQA